MWLHVLKKKPQLHTHEAANEATMTPAADAFASPSLDKEEKLDDEYISAPSISYYHTTNYIVLKLPASHDYLSAE